MKALIYEGPGRKSLQERPVPEIGTATDAIVKVTRTTICGHVLVPSAQAGRPLRGGRTLVALKMAKVEEIRARMMRLQLKLTKRRMTLARRTRVLTFCREV